MRQKICFTLLPLSPDKPESGESKREKVICALFAFDPFNRVESRNILLIHTFFG
jgi:hypothetical protein